MESCKAANGVHRPEQLAEANFADAEGGMSNRLTNE
jgi:hypothetical protein